jgi:hypothetical protein
LGWHLYDRATRTPHWDDHANWRQADALSFTKMRDILQRRSNHHGLLGSVRSVRAYEKHIGTRLLGD